MALQYQKSAFFKYGLMAILITGIGVLAFFYLYQRKTARALATCIYTVLDKYRITYDIDACSVDSTYDKTPKPVSGISQFIDHIAQLVAKKHPLNMLVVSFPFKSANHDKKTLSALPDMAERRSLEYLQTILNEIKQVYPPGVQLTVFCDGIPFAPLFHIPYSNVVTYQQALQALASDLPDIKLYTAADLMRDHHLKQLEDINTLIDTFNQVSKASGQSVAETTRKRLALEFDYPAGQVLLAKEPLKNLASRLSSREAAFQNYIHTSFPAAHYLRLTVHFYHDVSKKFGIKLSPHSCVTPYHGVLVEEIDGSWSIRYKKDINLKHYTLATQNINDINCPYFKPITERE